MGAFLFSLYIASFLLPSVYSSFSFLALFFSPPLFFEPPHRPRVSPTRTGILRPPFLPGGHPRQEGEPAGWRPSPHASPNIDYLLTSRSQTRWALIIRAVAFICIFIPRQQRRSIMFRWRRSLEGAWTISRNEGPAAMATIWWGRQGYLKEFSCCSRSRQLRAGPGERQRGREKKGATARNAGYYNWTLANLLFIDF